MNTKEQIQFTTLSMHLDLIDKLIKFSEETGLGTDEIICNCLARYSKEVQIKLNLERLSMYQPRCKMYKAFPVNLPQTLYEKCFDLRKSLKLSLSYIFAIAFMAYLDDLAQPSPTATSFAYSYKDYTYTAHYFYENGRRVFKYCWEKPPD